MFILTQISDEVYFCSSSNHYLLLLFQMKYFLSYDVCALSLSFCACLSVVYCSTYDEDLTMLQERLKGIYKQLKYINAQMLGVR